MHHGAVIPELGLRIDTFRGLDAGASEDFMGNLFFGFDRGSVIELSAKGDWGQEPRRLRMSLQDRQTVEIPVAGPGPGQPETQATYSRNELVPCITLTNIEEQQLPLDGWFNAKSTRDYLECPALLPLVLEWKLGKLRAHTRHLQFF